MSVGIDFGSTFTKLVVIKDGKVVQKKRMVRKEFSFDQLPEKLLDEKVFCTGTGATYIPDNFNDVEIEKVDEFEALSRAAMELSDLNECMVVSIGTGTSFVRAGKNGYEHVGGSGIGGALLTALALNVCGMDDINEFLQLAETGDFNNVDLLIKDVAAGNVDTLGADITVANLGKLSQASQKEDKALGICNLVFQNIGVMAYLAGLKFGIKKAVVFGTLAESPVVARCLEMVQKLFGMEFLIYEDSAYAAAIGAALKR